MEHLRLHVNQLFPWTPGQLGKPSANLPLVTGAGQSVRSTAGPFSPRDTHRDAFDERPSATIAARGP